MEEIYDDVSTTVEPPMIKRNRRELTPGKGNQWVALSTFQQPGPSRSFFSCFLFISSSEKRKLTEFVIQFIGL